MMRYAHDRGVFEILPLSSLNMGDRRGGRGDGRQLSRPALQANRHATFPRRGLLLLLAAYRLKS